MNATPAPKTQRRSATSAASAKTDNPERTTVAVDVQKLVAGLHKAGDGLREILHAFTATK